MTGKRGLWGFRYDTTHPKINHYKMPFRFLSAKWNAAKKTVHALLLQKLVHGSIFFARILHETGDGIKHVFTLLVVEMVRGITNIYYNIYIVMHNNV